MVWKAFEPRTPGQKANNITTELRRILPNQVLSIIPALVQLLGIVFKSGNSHA